ncbi:MAG: protein translocase subunit SecF [Methanoregulaceae archaeon]
MGFVTFDVNRYTPRQMVVLPMVLLIVSLIILCYGVVTTGMPAKPGMDFSGGTAITIYTEDSPDVLKTIFSDYPVITIDSGIANGKFIKFGIMDEATFDSLTTILDARYPDAWQLAQIDATFGQTLQGLAKYALVFSFIGMAIVVFLAFRSFVLAGAIILAAIADIAMTAATMFVIGIELTLPTFAGLLMLIGYSVDSDILLTMRVFKRPGKLDEKLASAFHTGIIMTTTTLAAIAAMGIVAYLGNVPVIPSIASVLFIGLVFDLMNTWFTNAGIIKWYVERQEAGQRKESGKKRGVR